MEQHSSGGTEMENLIILDASEISFFHVCPPLYKEMRFESYPHGFVSLESFLVLHPNEKITQMKTHTCQYKS